MWFAYVDESYNAAQHWVVALLIEHHRVNETQRLLRKLIEDASDDYGIPDDAELHGYDIFHGEQSFAAMHTVPRARIALYAAVFQTVAAADCTIILRGVDKAGLRRRYGDRADHPHRVTMSHLIERIDDFAVHRDDHALIVADEHHETQNVLLRDLVIFQEHGTTGYLAKKITRVVDTIHFVSSATNPLVQGADMIDFLALRKYTHRETDRRSEAAIDHLWDLVEPRVRHIHCWYP
jgi:Protein of unknown function (DUF3800)